MHIFLGILVFMLASSVMMVGYVLIKDIKHKKSQPAELADAGNAGLEEITADDLLTEYTNLRKKTA